MTAKQEVIKKAWAILWEMVKERIDENGWFDISQHQYVYETISPILNSMPIECSATFIRPFEIKDIEYNNDWFRIDEHDLPTKEGKYECWSIYNTKVDAEWFILQDKQSRLNNEKFWRDHYTHYRPVEQVKPPIY